ncbi:MAG: BLUF domain-containing protein [Henriciella sp.]|uniref:BLUF domain-containing protein n=1 Tax=Henriciella sp. TaxID=1968823 RepID=UPI003C7288F9
MYRLIYQSHASHRLSWLEIEAIAARATYKNARFEVTGVLFSSGLTFCQILEGRQLDIAYLMERIAGDPRHCNLKIITECDIEERAFDDWSMKVVEALDWIEMLERTDEWREKAGFLNIFKKLEDWRASEAALRGFPAIYDPVALMEGPVTPGSEYRLI